MRQVLQNLKTGQLEAAQVPPPTVQPGNLLVQTRCTLISAGTERMLTSFAKSSLIGKARQQPDKVKQVMDKIRTDGLLPTVHSVFARLDEPMPLGYCNCGTVIQVGEGVEGFEVGDRVASNGPHAEIVSVPKNLCAKVPDNVTDEDAAFTVLASIGLQGVRLIKPTFGETIVVFGLGLIGLLSVQLLKNSGCNVIGIDINRKRLDLAEQFGAQTIDAAAGADPVTSAIAKSHTNGVDAVLITATAKGDSIVRQSAQMCRKRGRIVLVGVVDLNLNRADFYEKELSFQVSCSYGPGRYDSNYEQKGQDYPPGFVRWTQQRNFQAVLDSLARGQLKVKNLISERIPLIQADRAYQMLADDSSKLALILTCPKQPLDTQTTIKTPAESVSSPAIAQVVIGLIGAGNFAQMTLLPVLKSIGARLKTVADVNGVAGAHAARKFGFEQTTNDYHQMLTDPDINTVIITTRHDLHAPMVIEALQAGKHVAVEKPLCLNRSQLSEIKNTYRQFRNRQLLVGFNRRFSPHAQKMRSLIAGRDEPLCMTCLVNAGHVLADSWVQDKDVGGGRIIGEGSHWIDLMRYLVDAPVVTVSAAMVAQTASPDPRDDKMSITLTFADGSVGTLHYFANGHKRFPKETLQLFCQGKILHLDNFRKLRGFGYSNFKHMNLWKQDKGYHNEYRLFIERIVAGGQSVIPFEEIENVTLASFLALESARTGQALRIV